MRGLYWARLAYTAAMSATWIAVVAGLAVLLLVLGMVAWLMWQHSDPAGHTLVKRITHLTLRAKLRLALARDSRTPLVVRAIPPLLILYLAMPIDAVPDFIPVLGHIDDVLILVIGIGLLLRFTPRHVLEGHGCRLEPEA